MLVYNVAYLFERTPYYRPWLSWVGVDLRRVSADDLVRFAVEFLKVYLTMRPARGPGYSPETFRSKATGRTRAPHATTAEVTAIAARLAEGALTHSDILHQIPGVVVFPIVASTLSVDIATRAGGATTAAAPSAPPGNKGG